MKCDDLCSCVQQKTQSLFTPVSQAGFRKNANPSHYNMRFKPSMGLDGGYIGTAAPYHGPNGTEPVSKSNGTGLL